MSLSSSARVCASRTSRLCACACASQPTAVHTEGDHAAAPEPEQSGSGGSSAGEGWCSKKRSCCCCVGPPKIICAWVAVVIVVLLALMAGPIYKGISDATEGPKDPNVNECNPDCSPNCRSVEGGCNVCTDCCVPWITYRHPCDQCVIAKCPIVDENGTIITWPSSSEPQIG